jgi:hypothetical protein
MTNDVDDKLNSGAQRMVARAVASLPEETVSMVWRSDLNEALRATAAKSKRRRFMFNFVSPIAGLGFACALALIVPMSLSHSHRHIVPVASQSDSAPISSSNLEADLIRVHQDDVRISDVTGAGLNPTEVVSVPQSDATDDDYEDDLQL